MREAVEYDTKDFENVASSNGVYAKFYKRAIHDEAKSVKEGRPIFDDVVFVEIIAAGNGTNIVRRPVRDSDKARFREAYMKFQEGDNDQIIGTPLSEVVWISRSMVEELSYIRVRTLEQLAELNDSACGKMPGLYELKRKAAAWLTKSSESAVLAENESLKERLAALEAAIADRGGKKSKKESDEV